MNAQAEESVSIADIVKQVFSLGFIVAAIVAFYYFSEFPLLYRVLALLAVILLALGLMLTTTLGKKVWVFFLESRVEVRKIIWPTREETTRTTLLVFGMVFVVGLALWFFDWFLAWGVRLLMTQGA